MYLRHFLGFSRPYPVWVGEEESDGQKWSATNIFLQPTYFCNHHIFAAKLFSHPKYFCSQIIFAAKIFLQTKYFCNQFFCSQNIFADSKEERLAPEKKKDWHQKRRKMTGTRKEKKGWHQKRRKTGSSRPLYLLLPPRSRRRMHLRCN